jgi:hypothetical protein
MTARPGVVTRRRKRLPSGGESGSQLSVCSTRGIRVLTSVDEPVRGEAEAGQHVRRLSGII